MTTYELSKIGLMLKLLESTHSRTLLLVLQPLDTKFAAVS